MNKRQTKGAASSATAAAETEQSGTGAQGAAGQPETKPTVRKLRGLTEAELKAKHDGARLVIVEGSLQRDDSTLKQSVEVRFPCGDVQRCWTSDVFQIKCRACVETVKRARAEATRQQIEQRREARAADKERRRVEREKQAEARRRTDELNKQTAREAREEARKKQAEEAKAQEKQAA